MHFLQALLAQIFNCIDVGNVKERCIGLILSQVVLQITDVVMHYFLCF